jgi:phosphoglycerate dehydrogenase-like enzyme
LHISAAQRLAITVLHGTDRPPDLARRAGDAHVRFATDATLGAALPGTDVLLVWDFTSDAVRHAWPTSGQPRWVHTASAGVDRLTFPALLGSPAVLTNSRGVFDTPMAEYVLGLVIAMAKDLPGTIAGQARRQWRHRETEPVAGRCAVVVGSGPIGRAIARLLGAVGMRVRLVGRTRRCPVPGDPAPVLVHGIDELPGLLPSADDLVLAAPLTDRTRGLVDATALAQLRPGARVINVGRGGLVVEDDLVAALRDGHVAGAALDVFAIEPLPPDSPLWTLPGVIVSPHMSGDITGWRTALVDLFAENLERYRAGEPLRNVVDKTLGYVSSTGGTA